MSPPPEDRNRPGRDTPPATPGDTTRRRRLLYRSKYTGMKETDLFLGAFAGAWLPAFTDEELTLYERLLEMGNDPLLYAWVTGRLDPPPGYDNRVLALMRAFRL